MAPSGHSITFRFREPMTLCCTASCFFDPRPDWVTSGLPRCKKDRSKLAPQQDATRSNAPQSAVACFSYGGSEE
jgi:hypothetical protein